MKQPSNADLKEMILELAEIMKEPRKIHVSTSHAPDTYYIDPVHNEEQIKDFITKHSND